MAVYDELDNIVSECKVDRSTDSKRLNHQQWQRHETDELTMMRELCIINNLQYQDTESRRWELEYWSWGQNQVYRDEDRQEELPKAAILSLRLREHHWCQSQYFVMHGARASIGLPRALWSGKLQIDKGQEIDRSDAIYQDGLETMEEDGILDIETDTV